MKSPFKYQFQKSVRANVQRMFLKDLEEATPEQIFQSVARTLMTYISDRWFESQKLFNKLDPKAVYYLSMEFLIGRALGNNLINLCIWDEVREALEELGIDLNTIEDQERDAALGNGGLGRLAACFLDSLTTLGYQAYGCGIRYRYGMFRQQIESGFQTEQPDNWLKNGNPFELRRPEDTEEVRFGGSVRTVYDEQTGRTSFIHENYHTVLAVPYDIPIVGYNNNLVNTLRVWDAEPVSDFHLDAFGRGDYLQAVEQENLAHNIVKVLYPNDNHYAGKELRLKQEYFFISASVQTAVKKYKSKHPDIRHLCKKVTFQMNDTHPAVAVAELMRILLDEEHLGWDEAWEITVKTMAYTNHTILREASEAWPTGMFSYLLPRIYQIIEEIDRRFTDEIRKKYPGDRNRLERMAIIHDGQIRMAHLAIVASYSVNGVARLHTQILITRELKDFYEMFPQKFNNKTNGITQRRFLLHGNPLLAGWVTEHIGDGWITDLPQISQMKRFADDPAARQEFMDIRYHNKLRLARYIKENNGLDIDPMSIFDIQVKRAHEYKRQLMNILHIMYLYNQLRDHPETDFYPRTFIFGGKAAAGYRRAKLTIKLINSVADAVNNDASIGGRLKVVYIEDYRVSNAELLFSAADVSEHISTASKEASGTGNMKFMLNGAPVLGTMDGANVEIVEAVGEDNAFIFGLSSDQVIHYERFGGYDPRYYHDHDPDLRRVLTQLIDGTYSGGNTDLFREIYDSLLNQDPFFVLADFRSYAEAQRRVEAAYRDRTRWAGMSIMNMACSGGFSSDRTVREYAEELWHLEQVL